jgi:hypothetical protein
MTEIEQIQQAWRVRLKGLQDADKLYAQANRLENKGLIGYDQGQDANNSGSQKYYDEANALTRKADLRIQGADQVFISECGNILNEIEKMKQLNDFYVKMGM